MQSGVVQEVGTMAIDGSVAPGDTPGKYVFRIQSRGGGSDVLGPVVTGEMVSGSGAIGAKLENFKFGPDIKAVLPEDARQWCNEHQLAGDVSIPYFYYVRAAPNRKQVFKVEMDLGKGVQLAVDANEWFSRVEQQQVQTLRGAFDLMRFAGLNGQIPADSNADSHAPTASTDGFVDALQSTVLPAAVMLQNVRGRLTFTQDGITISDLTGSVEQNDFRVSGDIHGYNPAAPATLEISGSGLTVPRFSASSIRCPAL